MAMSRGNQIKGALIGFAIGDAMGVATEFMSPVEIKAELGVVEEILGGGVFGFECGETSDDTAMTIAVANGIIANSVDPIEDIGRHFLKWRATRPKDIGIAIATTFRNYKGDWFEASHETYKQIGKAGGNGTLMRCLPIALAYSDLEKIEQLSRRQSKMTHYQDVAAEACVIYNRIAWRLLQGEELKASIFTEIKGTEYDIDYDQEPNCSSSGYVVDTLKWVFYWLLNRNSFMDVIVGAVNKGDDSDTIAAIAGGLKGLEIGFSGIPFKHVDKLLDYQYLWELAEVIDGIRDQDTLKMKEKQEFFLQELIQETEHFHELAMIGTHSDITAEMVKRLEKIVFDYRASLIDDASDFRKKYNKWWNVWLRFRRSRRLLDLGAPTIIIQHELTWLKLEVDHLNQIHQGIDPQYTPEELEELESPE